MRDTFCRSAASGSHVNPASTFGTEQAAATRSLRHILSLTAGCALSALIGMHGLAPPANAITTEQLLFLEAWRAIDRAYVDKSFNNQSWFKVCSASTVLQFEPLLPRVICCCKYNSDVRSHTGLLSCSYENST